MEQTLTPRKTMLLMKHCDMVEKKIIKVLKLKNFQFREPFKQKIHLTKEMIDIIKPICIDEKKYREKNNYPNPLWAFNLIQNFFILD